MRARRHPLFVALVLSLVLHALGIATLPVPEGRAVVPHEAPIEIALVDPVPPPVVEPPAEQPQIVAPPEAGEERPPERTRFQSDHDNVVLRETVRKGVPNPAPPRPPRRAAPAKEAEPAEPREAPRDAEGAAGRTRAEARSGHAPALEDLFASTDELVRAQQGRAERAQEQRDTERPAEGPRQRLALAVPPVAPEWTLPGTRGTLDNLPDIQRGDVTLLNTKANVFAPFVRRVGERVFQHLIIRQRRLALEQILSAREAAQMRVVLDTGGRLKSVSLETHSGSATMDETLADALNTAAFDNNPPPGAANADGEFEFVFQARLRAFLPGPGGQASRIESRLSVALL